MTNTYKKLAQVELAADPATTTIYTVPGGTEAIVKHMTVVNSTGGRVTFRLWRDGVADVNLITPPGAGLPKGAFWEWTGTMFMEAGATLVGQSDTATAVTVTVDGDEVT
jgi:hypothetical protein